MLLFRWFLFNVVLGLFPLLVKIIITFLIDKKIGYELLNPLDFYVLTIIVSISILNEKKEKLTENIKFLISLWFILGIVVSSIACTLGNIDILEATVDNSKNYKIFSIIMAITFIVTGGLTTIYTTYQNGVEK